MTLAQQLTLCSLVKTHVKQMVQPLLVNKLLHLSTEFKLLNIPPVKTQSD